ncbi:hypothetical protein NLS1_20630 [Nocardioides sp. LS1]|nr:hypothetical protein NLS1_20630 [Nocardioides sp. LS1]
MICFDVRVLHTVSASVPRAALRLVAALLIAGCSVVVLGQGPASACPAASGSGTTQDHTMNVSDVFTGDVAGVTRTDRTITYDVRVDRVYKGDVQTADVLVTTSARARSCTGVELTNGRSYVFFAQAGGSDLSIARADGTARAGDQLVKQVERLLGDGHAPTPPEPKTATFTRVAHAEPPTLPRLAAPGLALVLVGLLGLLVVRRVGSR